jgi:hypothetical protein
MCRVFRACFPFFSSKLPLSIETYSDGIRSKLEEFINKLDEGLRWRNGVFSLVFRVDTHFFWNVRVGTARETD